jgi:capsular exopolysaccharide synthesis family protein
MYKIDFRVFDLFYKKAETTRKTKNSVYPMSGSDTSAFIPPRVTASPESSARNISEHPPVRAGNVVVLPRDAEKEEFIPSPESSARNISEHPPVRVTSVVALPRDAKKEEFIPAEEFDLSKASSQIQRALDPGTILGEQFRILRTRLSLMQKQSGIRTILITSTVPHEGKSFTSYALAGVIAQEREKRILIIDADMRKRGSGKDYGLGENRAIPGTAQVLQGTCDLRKSLLKSTNPEFWFLPSGELPNNPSELLSSPEAEKMLNLAARNFDWVIVDAPPALALSDPALIAPLCDAVVFVLRANSTPAKLAQEAINKVGRERICGIVLNRKKQMHSSRHYYQYYYQKQN